MKNSKKRRKPTNEHITIEDINSGKDTADWIDSEVLCGVLRAAGKLDKVPVQLIGRYFWNPITNKVE